MAKSDASFRFGDFTLNTATRQLLLNGGEVHLSPKAFELLAVLVESRSRAVSKAELQERLWPSTFVEETNLAGLIAEIRRALRDPASQPLFVRTVYGFGYRFVGDVSTDQMTTAVQPGRTTLFLVSDEREMMLMEGANVIGRAPDATIQIDSPGVSRYHARILVADGLATLDDLNSKNGTFLDGEKITTSAALSDGREIRLGRVALTFRSATATSRTVTVPAATD
jgi:DNA-binding winged helix-turn-helix (wHTH) protein